MPASDELCRSLHNILPVSSLLQKYSVRSPFTKICCKSKEGTRVHEVSNIEATIKIVFSSSLGLEPAASATKLSAAFWLSTERTNWFVIESFSRNCRFIEQFRRSLCENVLIQFRVPERLETTIKSLKIQLKLLRILYSRRPRAVMQIIWNANEKFEIRFHLLCKQI